MRFLFPASLLLVSLLVIVRNSWGADISSTTNLPATSAEELEARINEILQ